MSFRPPGSSPLCDGSLQLNSALLLCTRRQPYHTTLRLSSNCDNNIDNLYRDTIMLLLLYEEVNIVTRLYNSQDNSNVYMALEFVNGGELFSYMRRSGKLR